VSAARGHARESGCHRGGIDVPHREEEFKITRRLRPPLPLSSRHSLSRLRIRASAFPRALKLHRNSPRFFCPRPPPVPPPWPPPPLRNHIFHYTFEQVPRIGSCRELVPSAGSRSTPARAWTLARAGKPARYLLYLVITSKKSAREREGGKNGLRQPVGSQSFLPFAAANDIAIASIAS